MAASTYQCLAVTGEVCDRFLFVNGNDSHMLYTNCCGKSCLADDQCADCHDWMRSGRRLVLIMKS